MGIIRATETNKTYTSKKEKDLLFYETISKSPSLLRINSASGPESGNERLVAGLGMIICFGIVLIVYDCGQDR
jgi:hypothetical protein